MRYSSTTRTQPGDSGATVRRNNDKAAGDVPAVGIAIIPAVR